MLEASLQALCLIRHHTKTLVSVWESMCCLKKRHKGKTFAENHKSFTFFFLFRGYLNPLLACFIAQKSK